MPRMETTDFGPLTDQVDVSLTNIENGITNLIGVNEESQDVLDDVFAQLKETHLGHELHLWEAEVSEEV